LVTMPQTGRSTTARLLAAHMLASVLIQSVWWGVSALMAVLARKRFGAGDWQTVMITAAVPTLLIMSVFWGDLLRRVSMRRYLVVHAICVMAPLTAAAFGREFWHLFICNAIVAVGVAGWSPAAGDIWKQLYHDRIRGRAFALITSAQLIGITVISYVIGRWLDVDQNSFRIYLPAAAVLYGAGILLLRRLVPATGPAAVEGGVPGGDRSLGLRRLVQPVLHLRQVLRADRTFYRYETAFMTYGVGWMICNALLPVLATDRLKMSYTEFAGATQVVYPLCMLVMMLPMGWVMDRLGPTRTSGLAFAWLTLYPLGLWFAPTVTWVGVATAFYGTAMAGVQIGWMLGPVTLAPSREKVSQYVAIHTTLVGLRGIVAQGIGMLLYRLTGSFAWPFAIAAVAFAWASWQMWRLYESMRGGGALQHKSAE